MAKNKLTIKLTEDQQKQIKDATGKSIRELNLDLDELSVQDLDKAAGGIQSPRDAATGQA